MQQANGDDLSISRGRWYFDRFDANGEPTGLRFLGEANKADLTPSVQQKERYTTTRATNNKIANVITQQKHTLTIDLMEFVPKNVAIALLGDDAVVTQTTTTVTNELVAGATGQAAPAAGIILQLAKKNVSAVTLTAYAIDGTTSTVLVLGTDYLVEDAAAGLVQLLGTANVTAAITIKAGYTAAASTGTNVTGGTSAKIIGKFVFVGDPTSGPKMDANFWRCEVAPAGAIAFLSDDFSSMPLTAEVLDDSANHPSTPLYEVYFPQ